LVKRRNNVGITSEQRRVGDLLLPEEEYLLLLEEEDLLLMEEKDILLLEEEDLLLPKEEGRLLPEKDLLPETLKMKFLMSRKTNSGETSTEKIRMVRPILLDIPKSLTNYFVRTRRLKKTCIRLRGDLP